MCAWKKLWESRYKTSLGWGGRFLIFRWVSSYCITLIVVRKCYLCDFWEPIFLNEISKTSGGWAEEEEKSVSREWKGIVSKGRDVLQGVQDEEPRSSGSFSHLSRLYQGLASRALVSLFIFIWYPSISGTWYSNISSFFSSFLFYF